MTTEDKIRQVIREVLDDETLELTDDTAAADIEAWDSLAHINIMFALESVFNVQFTNSQLYQFQNVGELRRFLESTPDT